MNVDPHNNNFIEALDTVSRKLRTTFDARVKEKGLTLARFRILKILRSEGSGASQSALAHQLEIEGPTLVRLLDHLEEQGTVERVVVDGDRRAKRVRLTPLGERRAEEIEELGGAYRDVLLDGIDQSDIDVSIKVFQAMLKNMGTAA